MKSNDLKNAVNLKNLKLNSKNKVRVINFFLDKVAKVDKGMKNKGYFYNQR